MESINRGILSDDQIELLRQLDGFALHNYNVMVGQNVDNLNTIIENTSKELFELFGEEHYDYQVLATIIIYLVQQVDIEYKLFSVDYPYIANQEIESPELLSLLKQFKEGKASIGKISLDYFDYNDLDTSESLYNQVQYLHPKGIASRNRILLERLNRLFRNHKFLEGLIKSIENDTPNQLIRKDEYGKSLKNFKVALARKVMPSLVTYFQYYDPDDNGNYKENCMKVLEFIKLWERSHKRSKKGLKAYFNDIMRNPSAAKLSQEESNPEDNSNGDLSAEV